MPIGCSVRCAESLDVHYGGTASCSLQGHGLAARDQARQIWPFPVASHRLYHLQGCWKNVHDPRRRSPKQDDDLLLLFSMLCFRFAEIRFLISNRPGPGGVWSLGMTSSVILWSEKKPKALQGEYTPVLMMLVVATSAFSHYSFDF